MMLTAKAEALLGLTGPHAGKFLVKIGRSNDPWRRLREINEGYPERAVCRWELKLKQAFVDGETAHVLETELKHLFATQFTSEGNEFYSGDGDAMVRAFQTFCISKMPKIHAAPGKAKGVR